MTSCSGTRRHRYCRGPCCGKLSLSSVTSGRVSRGLSFPSLSLPSSSWFWASNTGVITTSSLLLVIIIIILNACIVVTSSVLATAAATASEVAVAAFITPTASCSIHRHRHRHRQHPPSGDPSSSPLACACCFSSSMLSAMARISVSKTTKTTTSGALTAATAVSTSACASLRAVATGGTTSTAAATTGTTALRFAAMIDGDEDNGTGGSIGLTQKLAERLLHGPIASTTTSPSTFTPPGMKACIALAGGGASSISSLTSTSGASKLLLEGIILYDRTSYGQYVSKHPSPPPEYFVVPRKKTCKNIESTNNSSDNDDDEEYYFSFASSKSALLLANAALHHCMELVASNNVHIMDLTKCIGVGCASALISGHSSSSSSATSGGGGSDGGDSGNNNKDKRSECHICLATADGKVTFHDVFLSSGFDGATGATKRRRTRREEDEIVGNLILLSMLRHQQSLVVPKNNEKDDAASEHEENHVLQSIMEGILNHDGDDVSVQTIGLATKTIPSGTDSDTNEDEEEEEEDASILRIKQSAEQIIHGKSDAVVLVPSSSSSSSSSTATSLPSREENSISNMMTPLTHPIVPHDSLVFPGSFNPPHVGHAALARAAVKTLERKRRHEHYEYQKQKQQRQRDERYEDKTPGAARHHDNNHHHHHDGELNDVWESIRYHHHKSQRRRNYHPTVFFEMSLKNPDKPPLRADEAVRRVGLFSAASVTKPDDENARVSAKEEGQMPNEWGVLLTDSPLFIEKVEVLERHIVPSSSSHIIDKNVTRSTKTFPQRKMTFVIGSDTFVRIINPKYYGNSYDAMLEAVREMGHRGVHFVVGGRLEQDKEGGEQRFITGDEELAKLPKDVQEMFTLVREEDFRVDISSTELRKRESTMSSDSGMR